MTDSKRKKFSEIEVYYRRALQLIMDGDEEQAALIILNEMPSKLYDESLDILYSTTTEFSDKELRELIYMVDEALNEYSQDETPEDKFIADCF